MSINSVTTTPNTPIAATSARTVDPPAATSSEPVDSVGLSAAATSQLNGDSGSVGTGWSFNAPVDATYNGKTVQQLFGSTALSGAISSKGLDLNKVTPDEITKLSVGDRKELNDYLSSTNANGAWFDNGQKRVGSLTMNADEMFTENLLDKGGSKAYAEMWATSSNQGVKTMGGSVGDNQDPKVFEQHASDAIRDNLKSVLSDMQSQDHDGKLSTDQARQLGGWMQGYMESHNVSGDRSTVQNLVNSLQGSMGGLSNYEKGQAEGAALSGMMNYANEPISGDNKAWLANLSNAAGLLPGGTFLKVGLLMFGTQVADDTAVDPGQRSSTDPIRTTEGQLRHDFSNQQDFLNGLSEAFNDNGIPS